MPLSHNLAIAAFGAALTGLAARWWWAGAPAGSHPSPPPAAVTERATERAVGPMHGAPEDPDRAIRDHLRGVAAAFRAEPTDPRWSASASSVIRAALPADREPPLRVRGIECRSRTCRVELDDAGPGVLGTQLVRLAHGVGRELPAMIVDRVADGAGPATVVLYLSTGGGA